MSARDIRYGRRGGRLVPWAERTGVEFCNVCGGALTLGQKGHHYSCSPACQHGQPVDLCRGWKGACTGS